MKGVQKVRLLVAPRKKTIRLIEAHKARTFGIPLRYPDFLTGGGTSLRIEHPLASTLTRRRSKSDF